MERYTRPAAVVLVTLCLVAAWCQPSGGYLRRALQILERWDFSSSKILRSGFRASTFEECTFDNASFLRSAFAGSQLSRCSLRPLVLDQTSGELRILSGQLSRMDIDNTQISKGTWRYLSVRDVALEHSVVVGASLQNCELRNLTASNSRTWDTSFRRVTFSGGGTSDLDACTWYRTRFYNNDFDGVYFDWCDFSNGRLSRCDLSSMRFEDCDFRYCRMDGCDISGLTIDGVNVKEAIEFYKKKR